MRHVAPEILDHLSADDPRARRSRRDLERINAWLSHPAILTRLLGSIRPSAASVCLTELGGGDGRSMLRVAERLHGHWPVVDLQIVDRQSVVSPQTLAEFTRLGWGVRVIQMDVFDWVKWTEARDIIVANLFLHHFEDDQLAELLRETSLRTKAWVACEPRRIRFPLLAGLLVGLIGCNAVTRHDAAVSVGAGFVGQELSALWPQGEGWVLEENRAGLFSHGFVANRKANLSR